MVLSAQLAQHRELIVDHSELAIEPAAAHSIGVSGGGEGTSA